MPRIFVALPLPVDLARSVAALLPDHPALRRLEPALLHVTLAFVGALDEDRVAAVIAGVSSAARGAGAFGVTLDEVGRFPPSGAQRVVWAGTSDPAARAQIVELGAAVRAELVRHAVPFDAKPLLPHVTLARVRERTGPAELRALRDVLGRVRVPVGLAFVARSVHVMQSTLGGAGPRYTARAEIPLEGPTGR